jgi:putative spermidine/putrescine transport system permease protein
MPRSGIVWLLLGAAYFFVPLAATAEFSLKEGEGYGFSHYKEILEDPIFRETLTRSFVLGLETITLSLVLFIPTVYLVRLRLPRLRTAMEFLSILPFVVPPIVLIVGLLNVYSSAPQFFIAEPTGILVAGYVVLSFPYMYRSLDAGFRAVDIHTLTEAAQSLGAGWRTTLFRVILPNVRVAALSGAFLTLAIVMGEFTMANVALFSAPNNMTFPVYINYIGATQPNPAAALAIVAFGITWVAMLGILFLGRGRLGRREAQIGGAH